MINRIIYPQFMRQSVQDFASYISKSDTDPVTIGVETHVPSKIDIACNMVKQVTVSL